MNSGFYKFDNGQNKNMLNRKTVGGSCSEEEFRELRIREHFREPMTKSVAPINSLSDSGNILLGLATTSTAQDTLKPGFTMG